jgi:hypothetical protein
MKNKGAVAVTPHHEGRSSVTAENNGSGGDGLEGIRQIRELAIQDGTRCVCLEGEMELQAGICPAKKQAPRSDFPGGGLRVPLRGSGVIKGHESVNGQGFQAF